MIPPRPRVALDCRMVLSRTLAGQVIDLYEAE